MRKDDCGETDNLTGRNMPLRLIFDTTPSFLGHFRVGNGKSMAVITMDELCFSVRDHSLEEIDRTCRYKSLIFLAMTPNFNFIVGDDFNFRSKYFCLKTCRA